MPKFAAMTMMFTELPFLSRFTAAAEAGFDAVEFLFPYEFDKAELASLLATHGLTLVLHNLPAGDWVAELSDGDACIYLAPMGLIGLMAFFQLPLWKCRF